MKKNPKLSFIENGDPRLMGHYVPGHGIVTQSKQAVEREDKLKSMTQEERKVYLQKEFFRNVFKNRKV